MATDALTTQEYADQQGVSRRTVQRWIAQHLIFAIKIGRENFVPVDEQPPSFFQEQDRVNSDVVPPPGIVDPDNAGFPEEEPDEDFSPEEATEPEVDEEEEEKEDCRDENEFEHQDLRKAFSTRAEAESYASDIPVSTEVFRRCSDGFFQVAVTY